MPLSDFNHQHPVLAKIYANRGVSFEELDLSLKHLPIPHNMKGLDRAVFMLQSVIESQGEICVVGDFDADGACSTALMVKGLKQLGADIVHYVLPCRFKEGYGLSPALVERVPKTTQLVITVDNGISAFEGAEAAKLSGYDLIITDHHLPAEKLPAADAIVNPNQGGCPFHNEGKALAGVGVAFYVLASLRSSLLKTGKDVPSVANLLDLVALGTVADLVPMNRTNRILTAYGVNLIRQRKACLGVLSLLSKAGKNPRHISAEDISFAIAPRINAAGRLAHISDAVTCLLAQEAKDARNAAKNLDELNQSRKTMEASMQSTALDLVEKLQDNLGEAANHAGVCLFDSSWHQGVTGLLSGKIKEQFNRPVAAFAVSEEEGVLKGSLRSIAGVHIKNVLDAMNAEYPNLMLQYGGHAMAAGVVLAQENLTTFEAAFNEMLAPMLTDEVLAGEVLTDGKLEPQYINLTTAKLIENAGPWGHGFELPLFEGVFEVIKTEGMGGNKHVRFTLSHARGSIEAVKFNVNEELISNPPNQIEIAYSLSVNRFAGRERPQLMIEHLVKL